MRFSTFIAGLALLSASGLLAQDRVTFGVTGGLNLNTRTGAGAFRDEGKRYVAGPALEIRLWRNTALELNGLYRLAGYSLQDTTAVNGVPFDRWQRMRAHVVEAPLFLKVYLRGDDRAWRPFALAGGAASVAWLSGSGSDVIDSLLGTPERRSFEFSGRSNVEGALVTGGGVRFNRGRLALMPQVRYSYWPQFSPGFARKHQTDFLLGIGF